ncbi:MAG: hypothetical protein PHP23_08805 [Desulfobacterales bacterium]|nr:hypothetical protein [Desulfobacterales bacterium]MDD4073388.1 hypothetical protein [Desulfobacterales bacterium]MDD4394118.1 hypothetical protein [Desulfobacterales bacterium]
MLLSSHIRRRGCLCLVPALIVLFVTFCSGFAAEPVADNTVEVIGTGCIRGNNVEAARDKAVSNGLVAAIGETVSRLITSQAVVDQFQILDKYLYRDADNFIQDYKVLTQLKANTYYRVFIRATVSEDKIRDQLSGLGILSLKKDTPGLLLLIAERNVEDLAPKCWWKTTGGGEISIAEKAVARKMADKGFQIVSHADETLWKENGYAAGSTKTDEETALFLGEHFQADVVIIGTSEAVPGPNMMGGDLRSFEGRMTAQALRVGTGEKIAFADQHFAAVNRDVSTGCLEALTGAGTLVADDLAVQIMSVWNSGYGELSDIEIIVRGTKQLGHFVRFRKILNEVSGVERVALKAISGNEGTIKAVFHGTAKDLAQALMLRTYDDFGINISETDPQGLTVDLISDSPVLSGKPLSP